MSDSPRVTNASAFSRGSLALQVGICIVTLGLYTLYWGYSTAKQLDRGTDRSLIPILAVIPIVNIIAYWQIASAGKAVTNINSVVVFILFIFFPPAAWFLVQSGINDVAPN